MRLSDYLKLTGRTATSFAAEVGVSIPTITRAARGEVMPGRDLLRRIAEATGGAVMPNDFVDIDLGKRAA